MKSLLLLASLSATAAAGTLGAQAVTGRPDSSCTKYSDGRVECRVIRRRIPGDPAFDRMMFMRVDSSMARRAALGIELRPTGTRRDTLGVFVDAVTPKGPAESAGIVEGDRIAAINGVDLRTPASDTDDPYFNGLASHRLMREVQKLTPGSRVALRVYSEGRFREVQVVAGRASDIMGPGNRFNIRVPGPGGMMQLEGPGAPMFPGPEMRIMRERSRTLLKRELSADGKVPAAVTDEIRELAASAARDAQFVLKRLAADGVV